MKPAPLVKYRGAQDSGNGSTLPEGDTEPIEGGWWCPRLGLAHLDHVDVPLGDGRGLELDRDLMRELAEAGCEWIEAVGEVSTRRISIHMGRTVADLVMDPVTQRVSRVILWWRAWELVRPFAAKLEPETEKPRRRRKAEDGAPVPLQLL